MFKQYVPYVEDTVLGIFVECKADVSTFYSFVSIQFDFLLCILIFDKVGEIQSSNLFVQVITAAFAFVLA